MTGYVVYSVLLGSICAAVGYWGRALWQTHRQIMQARAALKTMPETGSLPPWLAADNGDDWSTGTIGPAVQAITAAAPVKRHHRHYYRHRPR